MRSRLVPPITIGLGFLGLVYIASWVFTEESNPLKQIRTLQKEKVEKRALAQKSEDAYDQLFFYPAYADTSGDGKISYGEVADVYHRAGYSELEVPMFRSEDLEYGPPVPLPPFPKRFTFPELKTSDMERAIKSYQADNQKALERKALRR